MVAQETTGEASRQGEGVSAGRNLSCRKSVYGEKNDNFL